MFRNIISCFMASAIILAPFSESYANEFMFRYRGTYVTAHVPPTTEQYGLGNDIVAHYVAPVGGDFFKKIPVATHDVVEWKVTSGEIPHGISLDAAAGNLQGKAALEETDIALLHGYDAQGHRIARAEVHFTVFQPVGVPTLVDFYAHTGTYFFGSVPSPDGTDVDTWVPMDVGTQPEGMSISGTAFEGTPPKAGTYDLAWRGFDYLGREVAYAYGTILVADGPVVEEQLAGGTYRETFGDQTVDKGAGQAFNVTPAVRHSLGTVTYRLLPTAARPSGLGFSSADGKLSSVYDDFDTSASFVIEARDSYDGTTGRSNEFKLTTLPASVDVGQVKALHGVVGKDFYGKIASKNVTGGATWAILQGSLPEGLSLDPVSGVITGRPVKVETQTGLVIGVSGAGMIGDSTNPFPFRIFADDIAATTEELHIRIGETAATKGVTVTKGAPATVSAVKDLPPNLSLDTTSGIITINTPFTVAGAYDQRLRLANVEQERNIYQVIHAYNPLTVGYGNINAKIGTFYSVFPTVQDDSAIGGDSYSIRKFDGTAIPSWMYFNKDSGRIAGTIYDKSLLNTAIGPFVVTRTDRVAKAESLPFTITLKNRDPLDLTILDTNVERFVTNSSKLADALNAIGSVTYSVVSAPSNWPATLRISSSGRIVGTTTDSVGTQYSGLVVRATDSDGTTKDSGPITLTVTEPSSLQPLTGSLDVTLSWSAEKVFTGTLPQLSNGYGAVTYAFSASNPDVAVTDPAAGAFAGTIATPGTYTLEYTIDDETQRTPAKGTLTIIISEDLEATAAASYELHRAADVGQLAAPTVTGGTSPYSFSLQGALPSGLSFKDGVFTGVPGIEGKFPVTVSVTDVTGDQASASFVLDVGKPLDFEIGYSDPTTLALGTASSISAWYKNAVNGTVAWQAAGSLPPGVSFSSTDGSFSGIATEAGHWKDITVTGTDGDGRAATATLTLSVLPQGDIDFPAATFTHRSGASFIDALSAANAVAPLTFSSADPSGIGHGLILNGTNGTISGSIDEPGTYPVSIGVTDAFGRKAASSVTVQIVGALTVLASDAAFGQYVAGTGPQPAVVNAVGSLTFSLKAGSLPPGLSIDPSSGAVTGKTDAAGVFEGIVIAATDAGDGTVASSGPFSVTVEPRQPLVVTAPSEVQFKRYQAASSAATVENAIDAVSFAITPDLPSGLSLDASTGTISGAPLEVLDGTVYTLTATDAFGGALGTATATFTLAVADRDKLGIGGDDAYAFNQFFPGTAAHPAVNAIGDVSFAISPALPDPFVLDVSTGTISGIPSEKMAEQSFTLNVTDAHDTASKTITLSVGDRKSLQISTAAQQSLILNADGYTLALSANNAVGAIEWQHVSGTLPAGISLDASTGTFSGKATEFGVVSTVTIRATDSKGGTDERAFVFSVIQDGTAISLSASGGQTRVGHAFDIPLPVADNVVGARTWSLAAGSTGLTIDPLTGKISGTPRKAFQENVTVKLKDATGREASAVITVISAGNIVVSAPDRIDLTFNRDAPASAAATAAPVSGKVLWSYSGTLPKGLAFDAAIGAFTGKPLELGTFGPITVTASDSLPGYANSSPIQIKVVMNDDPIELSVTDYTGKIGYPVSTLLPRYGNELGPVTFFSTDLAGTGLSIDSKTGILSGTPSGAMDRSINISIRDTGTTRVTSMPLRMQILPLMKITLPAQVTIPALTDIAAVSPTASYVVGGIVWDGLDQSAHKLPDGISFDTTTGTLVGNATELGTFGPFTVTATDSLGDRGTSNSFTIKVGAGSQFIGLAAATLPDALKRTESYSYDFKQNLTYAGMDESELQWSLGSGSPPGLTISKTGILSGTPTLSGTYTFDVSASYDTTSAARSYTLVVKLPLASLSLANSALPDAKRGRSGVDNSYSFDFNPLLTGTLVPLDKVAFTTVPGLPAQGVTNALPIGLTLVGGKLLGTATGAAGIYSFGIKATFTDNTDETVTVTTYYTMTVTDEIVFDFNSATIATAKKRLAYSFDLAGLINSTTIKGVTTAQLSWSWAIDPAPTIAPSMTGMPGGVSLAAGKISGTPTNSGTWAVVLTASYDGRTKSKSFIFRSDLQAISLVLATATPPSVEINKTYSYDFKSLLTATNIPADKVTWTATADAALQSGETAGLPPGLLLSGTTGLLSGTATTIAKYRFNIRASWSDGSATAETASVVKSYLVEVTGQQFRFKQVAVGAFTTCGVTTDGAAMCWGSNSNGGLGAGLLSSASSTVPVQVTGLESGVSAISATGNTNCAVLVSGQVRCWGDGGYGMLGNNQVNNAPTPVVVAGVSGASTITSGLYHTCAGLSSGGARCWGLGTSGQLGNNDTASSRFGVAVSGLTEVVASMGSGEVHTCAALADGTVKCWGSNTSNKKLMNAGTASSKVAVAATSVSNVKDFAMGADHSCVLNKSGAVQCFGSNTVGQISTSGLSSGVTDIAGWEDSNCAVVNGAVKCWGRNTSGQLGNGSITSGAVSVAIGPSSACAVLNTGVAKCWGDNSEGKLGNGQTADSTAPVTVGG